MKESVSLGVRQSFKQARLMKVGSVGIVRSRCQEPATLTLRPQGSLTAGSVTATEPQATVQSVREELPHGEVV